VKISVSDRCLFTDGPPPTYKEAPLTVLAVPTSRSPKDNRVTVTIKPAALRDACYIASKMRPADLAEIAAVVEFDNRVQIAAMLLHYAGDLAFCAYLRDEPVTVFGVSAVSKTVCAGWAYGTEKLKRTIPACTDYALSTIGPELMRRGYKRLEVKTAVDHDLSHRWLEGMGFVREGVARSYGFNGEDFAIYAITAAEAQAIYKGKR
jgi:hypothetical protein